MRPTHILVSPVADGEAAVEVGEVAVAKVVEAVAAAVALEQAVSCSSSSRGQSSRSSK